jgi:hypothetical protein
MLFSNMVRILCAGALMAPYLALAAQDLTYADLVRGEKLPAKLEISKIPEEFKAVKIKQAGSGGGGGLFDMFGGGMMMMMGMMGGMGGDSKEPPFALFNALEVSWTKGDVAKISNQDYLITYKLDLGLADMMASSENIAKPPKIEHVTLVLVKTDTIISMTPQTSLTREAFAEVLNKIASSPVPASEKTRTLDNAKQLSIGMLLYTSDSDDLFPYVQDTKAAYYVTYPYIKNWTVTQTYNPAGGMLRFNMALAGVESSDIDDPSSTPMYYESSPWADGSRVVSFADGSARIVSAQEWDAIEPNLRKTFRRAAKRPLPATLGQEWDKVISRRSSGGG